MKAGSGLLLVAVGLFVIYLGASGKLKYLGDAWSVLLGKTTAQTTGASNTAAPNTIGNVPITPGVINSLTSLFQGSAGASAATATTPGAATAAAAAL